MLIRLKNPSTREGSEPLPKEGLWGLSSIPSISAIEECISLYAIGERLYREKSPNARARAYHFFKKAFFHRNYRIMLRLAAAADTQASPFRIKLSKPKLITACFSSEGWFHKAYSSWFSPSIMQAQNIHSCGTSLYDIYRNQNLPNHSCYDLLHPRSSRSVIWLMFFM